MPIPLPNIPRVHCNQLRRLSFRIGGCLTQTEDLFANNGFIRAGDVVECLNCGRIARVDLNAQWDQLKIERLHSITCKFRTSDLECILRRAVFIRARRPRGLSTLRDNVVLDVIRMGFTSKQIQKAAADFFVDYGAFPDTNDLLEYFCR